MQLTDVVFTFYDIQGEPIADTPFTIQLVRSGFAHQTGVVLPEAIEVVTDALGKAIVALSPSSTPYYVTIDSMGHCGKQSYRFFVPESDVPLNFQDLIAIDELDPVVITEEKIRLIVEATAISKESAANAKISETNAKLSETNSKASEIAAIDAANSVAGALEAADASAAAAKISEDAAKLSQTSAAMSEQTANASAIAARTSELNAKASEDSAAFSALSSSQDASTATQKAQEAVVSASNAKASEDNAAASDVRVTALKGEVETTYQQNVIVKNEVQALLDQALAVGSGWSPVIKAVQDGADRCVLQIVDWTGGVGVKPAVGYIGLTGVVPTAGEAVNIQGANGADGSSFTVNATGPFSERPLHDNEQVGFAFLSTDTGLLYIREGAAGGWSAGIPFGKGDKGDKGERGEQGIQGLPGKDSTIPGPANSLTIGTVTTGPISAATITGQSPNQVLNLTLQPGPKGEQGIQGQGWSQAQTDKLNGIAVNATKNDSVSIPATSLQDFILQMHAYGPGYYRCESQIEGLPRFAAGLFTTINGTFTFVAADYNGGQPFVISGASINVAAGVWNYIEPGNRAQHFGTQAINTVAGLDVKLDAALRVRQLNETTVQGFLTQMWNLGPGYYRNDQVVAGLQTYSAGCFSLVYDTWTFVSADYVLGTPKFMSGRYSDIAAGTWKVFDFGSAAARNIQSNPNDDSLGSAMVVGAFGLGKLNLAVDVNLNDFSQFPAGTSYRYINNSTNGPYPNFYGYLTVEKVDNQNLIQTIKTSGTGVAYRRIVSTGTGPWVLLHDASTVVGNMSGGAIIEAGTNANGTYTKFADGTMICSFTKLINVSIPAGAGYSPPLDFAATFISTEFIHIQGVYYTGAGATGYQLYGLSYCYDGGGKPLSSILNTGTTPSTSHPGFTIGPNGASSVRVSAFAKGKWK